MSVGTEVVQRRSYSHPYPKVAAAVMVFWPYMIPPFLSLLKIQQISAPPKVSPDLYLNPPHFLHSQLQAHHQHLVRVAQVEWCVNSQHASILPTPDRILHSYSINKVGGGHPPVQS